MGVNGNYGQYTADARSVDIFMNDYPDMIPFFSVGDRGGQGSSQVTSPGTAKNVISIGASTTGADGSAAEGDVASFSSEGPTLDGRIKPDLVAPGVNLCSESTGGNRASFQEHLVELASTQTGLRCT